MGEAANDVLNGITCQVCDGWMPEVVELSDDKEKFQDFFDNPPGYPRTCPDCLEDE